MPTESYRLSISLGDHRFEAEGPEEAVREAYDQWRDLVKDLGSSRQEPRGPKPENPDGDQVRPTGGVPASTMDRVFSVDPPAGVSLRVLPATDKRDADALLMLLYGFSKLRDQSTVTGVRLNQSAVKSGLKLARIDRTIAQRSQYITKAGARKGTKYGLNNPGLQHAEKLVGEALG